MLTNIPYRCCYNGKEYLSRFGSGVYDYGFRAYDVGIGRFLSVDPLTKGYPWYTPYQFAGNKPIVAIDLDGLEEYIAQYKISDGKVTMISRIDNKSVDFLKFIAPNKLGESPNPFGALQGVTNKATGKLMGMFELGTIQYQYFDEKGNRLDLRRDYTGDYVKGANEIMPLGENNWFGSIYIGPNNPTYLDSKNNKLGDYRREPQDEIDAAAEAHDKGYDAKNASGISSALLNTEVYYDDVALNNAASKIRNGAKNAVDSKTGRTYSSQTKDRAKDVNRAFGRIVSIKAAVK